MYLIKPIYNKFTDTMDTKPDALIFDMDGTLWDAVDTYAESWNDYFRAKDVNKTYTKSDLNSYMGLEQHHYLEATLPEYPVEERNTIYNDVINLQYKRIEAYGGILYDGVVDGLARLSEKYKLFIVSNCPEHTITYFMKWAKIGEYITDTMAHGVNFKPKHENIKYLIKKHDLKRPLYIGDTESDAKQSSQVPLPFVFVEYGFGRANDFSKKFGSFNELTDYYLSI